MMSINLLVSGDFSRNLFELPKIELCVHEINMNDESNAARSVSDDAVTCKAHYCELERLANMRISLNPGTASSAMLCIL